MSQRLCDLRAYVRELKEECEKTSENFKLNDTDVWQNKFKEMIGDIAKIICTGVIYNKDIPFKDISYKNDEQYKNYINENAKDYSLPVLKEKLKDFFEYYTPARDAVARMYLTDSINALSDLLRYDVLKHDWYNVMRIIRDNIFSIYNSKERELMDFELYDKMSECAEELRRDIDRIEELDKEGKRKLEYNLAIAEINTIEQIIISDLKDYMKYAEKDQMYYNRLIYILNYISSEILTL